MRKVFTCWMAFLSPNQQYQSSESSEADQCYMRLTNWSTMHICVAVSTTLAEDMTSWPCDHQSWSFPLECLSLTTLHMLHASTKLSLSFTIRGTFSVPQYVTLTCWPLYHDTPCTHDTAHFPTNSGLLELHYIFSSSKQTWSIGVVPAGQHKITVTANDNNNGR